MKSLIKEIERIEKKIKRNKKIIDKINDKSFKLLKKKYELKAIIDIEEMKRGNKK